MEKFFDTFILPYLQAGGEVEMTYRDDTVLYNMNSHADCRVQLTYCNNTPLVILKYYESHVLKDWDHLVEFVSDQRSVNSIWAKIIKRAQV